MKSFILLSAAAAASASTVIDGSVFTGQSTHYGGNLNGGACSFSTYTLPSGILGTAYSGSAWDTSSACGACVEVTGPKGNTIKAMVVDKCPECDKGHLDLFINAFGELGNTGDGIISTSYKFVECGISSPLVLHNKEGTSAYWFSMQVVNANEPVASLEVSTDGGSTWKKTTRQDYNFFENPSGFGTEKVDVRVTSSSGSVVTVKNVSTAASSSTTAGSNFGGSTQSPPSNSSDDTTTSAKSSATSVAAVPTSSTAAEVPVSSGFSTTTTAAATQPTTGSGNNGNSGNNGGNGGNSGNSSASPSSTAVPTGGSRCKRSRKARRSMRHDL